MTSIAFPNIFTSTRTNVLKDKEATLSNLKLLLQSESGSLYGDPFYGSHLMHIFYEQNSTVLQDVVIDEIYTAIKLYIPQILVNRNDITLKQKDNNIVAYIKYVNLLNYTTNLYEINLTSTEY